MITIVAISLGTGLSLLILGLGDGGHGQMIENGVRIGQGHLTVQREGYLESPSISLMVPNPEPLVKSLASSRYVAEVYPRVRGEGILATASESEGVQFRGIDAGLPGEAVVFRRSMRDGEFLSGRDGHFIVVGKKLADRLNLRLGGKTVLTTQDATGEITSTLLRVRGIFRTGSGTIDGNICLIPIGTLQQALSMGNGVTSIALYLKDPFQQSKAFEALKGTIPESQGRLYQWQTLQPDLRDYVVIDNAFGYMTYAIILLIVAIGVLNTVFMSVMERRREIGILTAVGMDGRSVMRMVFTETVFITLSGIALGLVLGLGINWYFSVHGLDLSSYSPQQWSLAGTLIDPVLHSHLRFNRALGLCVAVFLLTITMGIYPAWKASRTLPVEAMEKP